jgi:hypothetical protein
MNVDLQELRTKVEKELKELEERRSALQDQLSHVEAVQQFAKELGDDGDKAPESEVKPETAASVPKENPRSEIFGQSLT